MGTYAEYVGNHNVPAEKLPELTQRMQTLFEQGGFMSRETVSMYGKTITLLGPVQHKKEPLFVYDFNYFMDIVWEPACYDATTGRLFTGKIGPRYFRDVVMAAYILSEFYSEDFTLTTIDGQLLPEAWQAMEWLNYLFDEKYSDSRLSDPWRLYRLFHDADYNSPESRRLLEYIDDANASLVSAIRYLTVVYSNDVRSARTDSQNKNRFGSIFGFPATLFLDLSSENIRHYLETTASPLLQKAAEHILNSSRKDKDAVFTIDALFDMCASTLESIAATHTEDKEVLLERIMCILVDHESSCPTPDAPFFPFWFSSYLLPKESSLKLISDVFALDFWKLLEELGPITEDRSEEWHPDCISYHKVPLGKRSTWEHLRLESRGLSDDDRAYYWEPDGDVFLSEDMVKWMEALCEELDEIENGSGELIEASSFPQKLIEVLEEADTTFFHVHFFHDSFYEFLSRSSERRIQATVMLLERMIERNRGSFSVITKDLNWWGYGDCGDHHPARLEIKRYLAVLGNPHLRQKWLRI